MNDKDHQNNNFSKKNLPKTFEKNININLIKWIPDDLFHNSVALKIRSREDVNNKPNANLCH